MSQSVVIEGIKNGAFESENESKPPELLPEVNIDSSASTSNNNWNSSKLQEIPSATTSNEQLEAGDRPTWGRSIEFLLSCISCSVGLGNIWRFPYVAYSNGGGAFLIPYIVVLLLVGKPMYYMEMILGQFSSRSSVKIWRVVPLLSGVGMGQIFAIGTIISYYCVILAIALHYWSSSFSAQLPWGHCKPEWGPNCVNSRPEFSNGTSPVNGQSSAELYFMNEVIKGKADISDGLGLPDWRLTLWQLLTWVVVVGIIIKGVRSTGKAAYFLAIFPYLVLIIILVRAVTLPGSADGIMFFIKPQFDKLLSAEVWYAAASQMFFSLNVGMAAIVMFSSYNKFDHNIYRDAMIVTIMDTFTSLLGGVTTFAVLGNLAHNLGIKDVGKVVSSGVGLAFVSYPDALAKIEFIPQLFSVLFFFMLFVLGVGSLVALVNAVSTAIWDQFPKMKYWQVILPISAVGFLLGLVYLTPGGQWILTLVDFFGGTFIIFVLAIIELIGVFWIYGLENFCDDVEFMLNRRPSLYWKICWGLVTPVFMIIIFLYSIFSFKPLTYNGKAFPEVVMIVGWIIFAIGLLLVPLWSAYVIGVRAPYKNFIKSLQPKESWGPNIPEIHQKWVEYKARRRDKRMVVMRENNWSELKYKFLFLFNKHE